MLFIAHIYIINLHSQNIRHRIHNVPVHYPNITKSFLISTSSVSIIILMIWIYKSYAKPDKTNSDHIAKPLQQGANMQTDQPSQSDESKDKIVEQNESIYSNITDRLMDVIDDPSYENNNTNTNIFIRYFERYLNNESTQPNKKINKFMSCYKKYFNNLSVQPDIIYFLHRNQLFPDIYRKIYTSDVSITSLKKWLPILTYHYNPDNIKKNLKKSVFLKISNELARLRKAIETYHTDILLQNKKLNIQKYRILTGQAGNNDAPVEIDQDDESQVKALYKLCMYLGGNLLKPSSHLISHNKTFTKTFYNIIYIKKLINLHDKYSIDPKSKIIAKALTALILLRSCSNTLTGIQLLMLFKTILSKANHTQEKDKNTIDTQTTENFDTLFDNTRDLYLKEFLSIYKLSHDPHPIIQLLKEEIESIKNTKTCFWVAKIVMLNYFINSSLKNYCTKNILHIDNTLKTIDIEFFIKFILENINEITTTNEIPIYHRIVIIGDPLTQTLLNNMIKISSDLQEIVVTELSEELKENSYFLLQKLLLNSKKQLKVIYKNTIFPFDQEQPPKEKESELKNLISLSPTKSFATHLRSLNIEDINENDLLFFKQHILFFILKILKEIDALFEYDYFRDKENFVRFNSGNINYSTDIKNYIYKALNKRYNALNEMEKHLKHHINNAIAEFPRQGTKMGTDQPSQSGESKKKSVEQDASSYIKNENILKSFNTAQNEYIDEYNKSETYNPLINYDNATLATTLETLRNSLENIESLKDLFKEKINLYYSQSEHIQNLYLRCYCYAIKESPDSQGQHFFYLTEKMQEDSIERLTLLLKRDSYIIPTELHESIVLRIEKSKENFFINDFMQNEKLICSTYEKKKTKKTKLVKSIEIRQAILLLDNLYYEGDILIKKLNSQKENWSSNIMIPQVKLWLEATDRAHQNQ